MQSGLYTLAAKAGPVTLGVGGDLNINVHVLTVGSSLDITGSTGFEFAVAIASWLFRTAPAG